LKAESSEGCGKTVGGGVLLRCRGSGERWKVSPTGGPHLSVAEKEKEGGKVGVGRRDALGRKTWASEGWWADGEAVGWKRRWAARGKRKEKEGEKRGGPRELPGRGLERKGKGEGREGWVFLFFSNIFLTFQTFKTF
jgi:hypothetical protein